MKRIQAVWNDPPKEVKLFNRLVCISLVTFVIYGWTLSTYPLDELKWAEKFCEFMQQFFPSIGWAVSLEPEHQQINQYYQAVSWLFGIAFCCAYLFYYYPTVLRYACGEQGKIELSGKSILNFVVIMLLLLFLIAYSVKSFIYVSDDTNRIANFFVRNDFFRPIFTLFATTTFGGFVGTLLYLLKCLINGKVRFADEDDGNPP